MVHLSPSFRDFFDAVPKNHSEYHTFREIASSGNRLYHECNNGKEFLSILEKETTDITGSCVSNLIIAGHGHGLNSCSSSNGLPGANMQNNEGFYYYKNDNSHEKSADISELKKMIKKDKIFFCKSCLIQIYACRIGSVFAKKIAKTTGCRVVFASGSCSSITTPSVAWQSGPGAWREKTRIKAHIWVLWKRYPMERLMNYGLPKKARNQVFIYQNRIS